MRKFGLLVLLAAFFVSSSYSQTPTVVTGTIKDTNGVPYSFAKVSAQLIPTTASPTIIVSGIPAQIGGQQNANADVNGVFSMNLFCNSAGGGCSVISPSGTQWQISVNVNGAPAPLGTGPQACSATLTITGSSQSVSSSFSACPALSNVVGITPVSSLPATCAVGAQYILPDGTVATCGPVANKFVTSYNGKVTIDPRVFGAKEDTRFFFSGNNTITLASGTANLTVTGANFCNAGTVPCAAGQTTDVGKSINVTNANDTSIAGATTGAPVIPANTTVLSVQSASALTLSANATANGAASVAIFTDDDAAAILAGAALAALPNCGTIHLVGWMAVKSGQFNTQNVNCAKSGSPADIGGGSWMTAEAVSDSGIYIENEFNPATCTGLYNGSSPTNVCFLAAISGGNNFGFFGLFNSKAGSSDTVTLVGPFGISNVGAQAFTNVNLYDYMGGDDGAGANATTGLLFSGGTLMGIQVQGFGSNACKLGGPAQTQPTVMLSGSCGNTKDANLLVNGPLITRGVTFGQTATSQTVTVAGGTWYSHSDTIYGNPQASISINVNTGAFTAFIDDLFADNSGVTGNFGLQINSGATVHLARSFLKGGATGGSISVLNGATLFDEGGNNFASVANIVAGSKIFGSLSNTGTACATGNWALTSGWGTSTIASVTAGGDAHRCQVVITGAAGAASPVLTWTFPSAYLVAPGSCQISFNGTLTGESSGAPSTTSIAFTFTGTPSAQTYRLDASCGP